MTKTLVKATVITLAFLLSSITLISMPVQAQSGAHGGSESNAPNGSIPLPAGVTADTIIKSDIYLSFRPNPVGLGQPIWLTFGLTLGRRTFDTSTITK